MWLVDNTKQRTDSYEVAIDIPASTKACLDMNDKKIRLACAAAPVAPVNPVAPVTNEIKYFSTVTALHPG